MDIQQLVESVTTKGSPKKCWAARLTGEAKAFADACTQVELDGGFIDRMAFVARMLEVYDVEVGYSVVRNHFGGSCSCPR